MDPGLRGNDGWSSELLRWCCQSKKEEAAEAASSRTINGHRLSHHQLNALRRPIFNVRPSGLPVSGS